jgi:diaminopimelate decarboxylase
MNHFDIVNGVLHCEGVALSDISKAVGTPVYVYSSSTLERHYQVFRDAFRGEDVLVAYALKANSNIAVIATLARLGAGADTVSAGEIKRAVAAGVPPSKILFAGVGKTAEELLYAVRLGVRQINVESPPELDLLSRVAAEEGLVQDITIRINPDVAAGGHAKISTGKSDSKFGVSLAEAEALYAKAAALPGVRPVGIACHIGSQIQDLEPLRQAFVTIAGLVERLRAQGLEVSRLDLGGGLGVPYYDAPNPPGPAEYAQMVRDTVGHLGVHLAFEPGRLIAGNAGVLVAEVLHVHERVDRRFLVLDAAMNDLIRPAMYDAWHDLRAVSPRAGAPELSYDVVGPVCETGDTFARDRMLPRLESGDLVAFFTAGAYGATMSSTYNTRPLVPEVLVRGDTFEVIRRRVSVDDLIALETIPDWLTPHVSADRTK